MHIARNPKNLNRAYFTLHPDARPFPEHIEWHKRFGFDVRGLPWDVWKRELLGLGTERLRKNALFPFIDFIRALSEDQTFFPPTDISQFAAATADLDIEAVPQLELIDRYTRFFITSGFYDKLPSGPTARNLRADGGVDAKPAKAWRATWSTKACGSTALSSMRRKPITCYGPTRPVDCR